MNQKGVLSFSVLAAAWLAFSLGSSWAQGTSATKSERIPESGTPMPKGAGQADTPMKGATGQSQSGQSLGQSQGSPGSSAPGSQDKSVSGTRSERTPDSGVPMPKGAGQSDRGFGSATGQAGQWGAEDVKHAQEALKSAGHDPGPIDGKIGPQTRQALKAFQGSNGLKETGTLDAQTAKKLGIDKGGSAAGTSSSERGGSVGPSSSERKPGAGSSQKESSSPPMGK